MIRSMKKAIERLKSGDTIFSTHTQDERVKGGTVYAFTSDGKPICAKTMERIRPEVIGIKDGLFDGESQTFALREAAD